MRRVVLLLLLCGCASGGAVETGEVTPRQATIATDPSVGTLMADEPHASSVTIAAPPATVWLAVKKVYAEFEIPITVDNPAAHQIGNQNFIKSRRMAGESMANWVDCGSSMTGPKATTYRIYASLLTNVLPEGQGTKLLTTFTATGQDIEGGSGTDRIVCGTTGRFEQYFLQKVKETLGKS